MANSIPPFTYYDPDAATKVFVQTDRPCDACGVMRSLMYTGPFYTRGRTPSVCPMCIASGKAALAFAGSFNDVGFSLDRRNVADKMAGEVATEVLAEIRERTPGYESWQGNIWLYHCSDGAVFRGDATAQDIQDVGEASRKWWEAVNPIPWEQVMPHYVPGQDIGVYRFDCRHCGLKMFHWDQS